MQEIASADRQRYRDEPAEHPFKTAKLALGFGPQHGNLLPHVGKALVAPWFGARA
jgi:hypothetical protein